MTTILQAPPQGVPSFGRPSLKTSSYPEFASIRAPMQHDTKPDTKTPYFDEVERAETSSAPSSAPSSPTFTQDSIQDSCSSTPTSSVTFEHGDQALIDDESDEDDYFPLFTQPISYSKQINELDEQVSISTPELKSVDDHLSIRKDRDESTKSAPSVAERKPSSVGSFIDEPSTSPDKVNDDQYVEPEPTRHVDYLSHEWREEDIWSSWRYIVGKRSKITNSVRLENAAWRTWVKAKYNLKTVSPETLNWLKDCDVTWLYGPLQVETRKSLTYCASQPPSNLSKSSSFLCKKPILKKKSASAVILERSRSQHSLLQRASDIIRQQQSSPAHSRNGLRVSTAEFALQSYTGSSVANTPNENDSSSGHSQRYSFAVPEAQTPADQKHVFFNPEVRQVQAIESDDDEKDFDSHETVCESDEDDDGGLVMDPKGNKKGTPRNSFSNEGKTIIPLPSTTLKFRTDTPEPPATQAHLQRPYWVNGRKLSPSPSQETLRPTRPNHNFLIDDDPEISDEPWHTSSDSVYSPYDEDENEPGQPMRRTESGMFMPYDENEDEAAMNQTLFGQAVYAVNTFKDIAHVVWNVGWNRR